MDAILGVFPSRRWAYSLAFGLCAALIGYALYLQYGLGLEPCPLCIFQRVVVLIMGIVFLAAAVQDPHDRGARVYALLLTIAGAVGIALALRHLWIQAQPAGSVPTCGMGLNYMLETFPVADVIEKVLKGSGECSKVDVVLGMSIPMWTLLLFVGLTGWALLLARSRSED
jgi:disulfide bond formation protein DsbB